jgi:hypothetical protein
MSLAELRAVAGAFPDVTLDKAQLADLGQRLEAAVARMRDGIEAAEVAARVVDLLATFAGKAAKA